MADCARRNQAVYVNFFAFTEVTTWMKSCSCSLYSFPFHSNSMCITYLTPVRNKWLQTATTAPCPIFCFEKSLYTRGNLTEFQTIRYALDDCQMCAISFRESPAPPILFCFGNVDPGSINNLPICGVPGSWYPTFCTKLPEGCKHQMCKALAECK